MSATLTEIASPYQYVCEKCSRVIDERYETVWNQTLGWEKKRMQGGTNHLALRRPQNRFMCHVCMSKILDKMDPGQENLFEL
ncbi:MAG: hypothetical protein H0U59_05295 [Gemmatimonadaceae bacterium]|nr:hypothetical protein [Gemmatimonadaceae bacterium]